MFPEDAISQKHSLSDAEIGSPMKRRRVLSFAEPEVDDSEHEDRDFWFTKTELDQCYD